MPGQRRGTAVLVSGLLALALLGPAPAAAQEAGRPPDVGYIGDSLGVEAENEIRNAFRHRRPFNVLALTNGAYVQWVRRHWVRPILRRPPSILIVELGHGDANKYISPHDFGVQVRAFLREVVPHVDCIRWLDVRERPTYYPPVNDRAARYNEILRREAARYRKVRVVHYSAWVDEVGDQRFERDRMHLTPVGERALARMVRLAADGCDPTLSTGPWWDVPDHYWAAPAVAWLHEEGIVRGGFGNGTFRAVLADLEVPLARRDLALWLWRREGAPTGAPPPPWPDVPPGLQPPVGWMADEGLIGGFHDDTFRPERDVSRGELVRVLWRQAGSPVVEEPAPWSDVPPGLAAPLAWAWSEGLATGHPDGTFRPTAPATRAQAAHLLAPADLPDPAPTPPLHDAFPPPRVLRGDAPQGTYFLDG